MMTTLLSRLALLLALALPSVAAAQRVDPVYIDDRFNQLQQTITMLTGQIEQLQNRNQQLQQQLEKMQTDYEFRIEQLEKGGGRSVAAGPRPAAPPPPPPNAPRGPSPGAPPPPAGGAGEQVYNEAFKMLQEGDYAGAERGFKAFLQSNPQHPLAANAQYWLGESYYARRDYQHAAVAFAEGYKVYKNSAKGPDNLLKLGITLSVMGKKDQACAMFARFSQDYRNATDLQKRRVETERQKNGCS